MNNPFLLLCVLLSGCLSAPVQTHTRVAPLPSSGVGALTLSPIPPEPNRPDRSPTANAGLEERPEPAVLAPAAPASENTGAWPFLADLSASERELNLEFARRIREGGYLTKPTPRSQNAIDRGIDAIFEPEVIRGRKVSISSSLTTAIKRKNPLCLLNPIFFDLSW